MVFLFNAYNKIFLLNIYLITMDYEIHPLIVYDRLAHRRIVVHT